MIYQSTRDSSVTVNSAEAIVKGIAPDGGLFVPKNKPELTEQDIIKLSTMNYKERACFLLGQFLTDFSPEEIENCVNTAYSKPKFETDSVAPVYELNQDTYILELWHGPTCAFKDMALQILPHLLTKAMKKVGEKREVVILVATSGDTGKAALEGFKDVEGTRIIVFYPEQGVSEIQKLQMITQEGSNVSVVAVKGNFDDAQNGVKLIFGNVDFNQNLSDNGFVLSSANSINWGRLAPQIVYYFSAYCDLVRAEKVKSGELVNICVPTGNFGNILAAYYAKQMGLPIGKLICASNINNVLTDFIDSGVYDKNRQFKTTISPSMDILISSNLERFLFDITGEDSARVKAWMNDLKETGKYEVPDITKAKIRQLFYGGYCSDESTKNTIAQVWKEYNYLMDTHTAVAMDVCNKYRLETGDNSKVIIASTASPFKFSGSVLEGINANNGIDESTSEFRILEMLSEKCSLNIPKSLADLEEKQTRFNQTCDINDMSEVVKNKLL